LTILVPYCKNKAKITLRSQRREDALVSCTTICMVRHRKSASIYRYLMRMT